MLHKVFTIYDSKSEAYCTPFYANARGQCIRNFVDSADSPESAINKHPEDYTLFELGTFDDCKAVFEMHPTPISLGVAIELIGAKL